MKLRFWAFMAAVVAGGACSSGGNQQDAPAGDIQYTGELVDWDSTDTLFCGVFQAMFVDRSDPTRNDSTNPNGRFDFMIASAPSTLVDITPPPQASECVTNGMYTIPGIAVATRDVLTTGMLQSYRMITTDRMATFFPAFGLTYDATKAQVFVHVAGTAHAVSISSSHATTLAFDGSQWAAGDTGVNVYFPNVDVGTANTAVTVSGSAIGIGTFPVAANTFTYLTVVGS